MLHFASELRPQALCSLVALPRIFKDFDEIGEVSSDTNNVDLLAIADLEAVP